MVVVHFNESGISFAFLNIGSVFLVVCTEKISHKSKRQWNQSSSQQTPTGISQGRLHLRTAVLQSYFGHCCVPVVLSFLLLIHFACYRYPLMGYWFPSTQIWIQITVVLVGQPPDLCSTLCNSQCCLGPILMHELKCISTENELHIFPNESLCLAFLLFIFWV